MHFDRGPWGLPDIRFPLLERWTRSLFAILGYTITPAGWTLLVAVSLCGYLGLISPAIPIFHLFSGLLAVWLIALSAFVLPRRKSRITVHPPGLARAGETFCFTLEVQADPTLRREIEVVCQPLPRPLVHPGQAMTPLNLPAGESVRVPLQFTARQRGFHSFPPPRLATTWPLGLLRRTLAVGEGFLLKVHPRYTPLAALDLPVGRLHQPGGIILSSRVGESPEYIGNREYRPGDPIRHIDWRAWARITRPVVREFQEEYFCRVGLILDTCVAGSARPGPEGHPLLEAGVSLAAAAAEIIARDDHVIDLFAAGETLHIFRAGRSIARFENVLDILSCVDPSDRSGFDLITPAISGELQRITSVLCIMLGWDRQRAAFVQEVTEAGCAVRVIVIHPDDTRPPELAGYQSTGDAVFLTPAAVRSGNVVSL